MALIDIDFARDNAWLQQMQGGDLIAAEEQAALWHDLVACYTIAQSWEAVLAAVDVRIARLELENTRLREQLAQRQALPSPAKE